MRTVSTLEEIDFTVDEVWNLMTTPAMAQAMLAMNREDNRRWRPNISDKYAHDMESGNWCDFAPDCIVFDSNGKVMSGQHRLNAIMKSGKTIGLKIMTGQPPENFSFIDGAHPRRVSDFIHEKNAKTRETATILLYKVDSGISFRTAIAGGKGQSTRQDALLYYSEHMDYVGRIAKAAVAFRNSLSCGQTRAYILFSHCITQVLGPDVLDEFLSAAVSPTTAFMFKFRETIIKRYSKKDAKPQAAWLLGMLFQAIEVYEANPERYSLNKGDAKVSYYEDRFREKLAGRGL